MEWGKKIKYIVQHLIIFVHLTNLPNVTNKISTLHSQILATCHFSTNHDIVPWIGEELHIGAEFQELSRNDKYVRVPGKLSETHSKVQMFSNPGDKVLNCVKTRGQICLVI